MKKIIFIAIASLILVSCKKEEPADIKNGTIVIFTSNNNYNGVNKFYVIINNNDTLGELKHNAYPPSCGEAGFITMENKPGKYTLIFKNNGAYQNSIIDITIESDKCKNYDFVQ
ncbi:MAG: hypothetical protein V4549_06450 [Bacteroidota bacterium]